MRKTSILIVDDHAMVRESLAIVLNQVDLFEVVGHAGTREEALQVITEKEPTVVLLDINMQPVSGFRIAEEILAKNSRQKIIGISSVTIPVYAKKLMKIGAKGFVSKSSTRQELEEAILTVANGYIYLSDDIRKVIEEISSESKDVSNELSARELEIIREIAGGHSSKEIADHLGISFKTVEVHRHNLMRKTGAKNTAALVSFIITHGLMV